MEEPIDRGLPFELYDIWRKSILTPNFDNNNSVFDHVDFDLPNLDHGVGNGSLQLCDIEPLDASKGDEGSPSAAPLEEIKALSLHGREEDVKPENPLIPDIWDLRSTLDDWHRAPQLRTWEAFYNVSIPYADGPTYVSEAGPTAFHALLSKQQPSVPARGALPQDVALRALASVAVGRSSMFFRWDEANSRFEWILKDAPFLGLSLECTQSLIESVMQCGVDYRSLEAFALGTLATCTALSALKRCVALVLECVDNYVTSTSANVRSLLQLQTLLWMPTRLLSMLHTLSMQLRTCSSDLNLLNAFSTSLMAMAGGSLTLQGFLSTLFEHVSAPWLELTLRRIGLGPYEATNAVVLQHNAPNMPEGLQSTAEHEEVMPDVVDRESQRLMKETKIVLETLSEVLPRLSPALYPENDARRGQPAISFNADALLARSKHQEADITEALQSIRCIDGHVATVVTTESHGDAEQDLSWPWSAPTMQECCLDNLASNIVTLSGSSINRSEQGFKEATLAVLQQLVQSEDLLSLQSEYVYEPLNRLRPLLETQWRLSNATLLRHLFKTCKLRDHLQLQRDFHLFGSGDFVARLSMALFSPDLQSAERKRGNIPKTTTMGLRLGASDGQRWPPASSELRLTLIGLLTQTSHALTGRSGSRGERVDLPGDLSFAIRELSDAEIDRVMDPSSIHALDFLRLQYTAPPPLHSILTTAAMQKYDDVFRHLLRLLRVLHVTTSLRLSAFTRRRADRPRGAASSFTVQAHHIVTTLLSHGMDVGIEASWCKLSSELNDIESSLVLEDDTGALGSKAKISLEGLKGLHDDYLDAVRAGLYLKRKQDQIRSAVESLLSTILRCASAIETSHGMPRTEFAAFNSAMKELLELLQDVATKPPKPSNTAAGGHGNDGESEQTKCLLDKLNWNRFYGDTDDYP